MEQNNFQEISKSTGMYRSYQGGYFHTLISPEQSGGTLAMMDMVLPKGAEPPLHIHSREDETFYILNGSMGFRIGDETRTAGIGEAVFAPRLVPHSFRILSTEARFITVISPGSLWHYFMEFSSPCSERPIVTPPQGPPPPELISQLIARMTDHYAITFFNSVE